MDQMPGAMAVDAIPFGSEAVIPAVRPVVACCDLIPDNLDDLVPGPVLAGFLASIDVVSICGLDQIVVMRAHQRMASHYQASVYPWQP